MEPYENIATQELSGKADTKIIKVVIITLAILAMLLIIAVVALNFFPELVISPKNMYLLSEKGTVDYLEKQIDSYNKNAFVQDSLKIYNTPYKQQSDISMKFKEGKLTGKEAQQLKMINDILSTTKISVDQSEDIKNQKSRSKLSLITKGNKLIDIDMFLDGKSAGISVPAVFNKYVTLNTQNLRPVYEKFGVENGPKKLITNSDIVKAINIDKKDLKSIQKDYIKFFTSNISEKDVTFSKDAEITTAEGNIKCSKIILTLDETRLKDTMSKLCDKISTDEKLLNIVANNLVSVAKLYDDAGYYDGAKVDSIPEELKDVNACKNKIKEGLKDYKKELAEDKDKGKMVMNLFVDRSYNVLEREVQFFDKSAANKIDDKSVLTIRLAGYKNPKSNTKNNIFVMTAYEKSVANNIKFNNLESPKVKGKPETSVVTFNISSIAFGKETDLLKGKFNVSINKQKDKQQIISSTFSIDSNKDYSSGFEKITGKFTETMNRNAKDKTMDTSINIDADLEMPSSYQRESKELGLVFDIKSKMKFDVPVEMPKFETKNTLDLNNASKQDIQSAMSEIQTAAYSFLMKNAQLFSGNQ